MKRHSLLRSASPPIASGVRAPIQLIKSLHRRFSVSTDDDEVATGVAQRRARTVVIRAIAEEPKGN